MLHARLSCGVGELRCGARVRVQKYLLHAGQGCRQDGCIVQVERHHLDAVRELPRLRRPAGRPHRFSCCYEFGQDERSHVSSGAGDQDRHDCFPLSDERRPNCALTSLQTRPSLPRFGQAGQGKHHRVPTPPSSPAPRSSARQRANDSSFCQTHCDALRRLNPADMR